MPKTKLLFHVLIKKLKGRQQTPFEHYKVNTPFQLIPIENRLGKLLQNETKPTWVGSFVKHLYIRQINVNTRLGMNLHYILTKGMFPFCSSLIDPLPYNPGIKNATKSRFCIIIRHISLKNQFRPVNCCRNGAPRVIYIEGDSNL